MAVYANIKILSSSLWNFLQLPVTSRYSGLNILQQLHNITWAGTGQQAIK
jgi:hypothetical protein